MKKVLVLSALGCVATVGAVFAAFTLDPTTERDIIVSNIDVDLSSQVFSEFESLQQFDYYDYDSQEGKVVLKYANVPVNNPTALNPDLFEKTTEFKFKSKRTETGGGTLDLQCENAYTYDNWVQYLDWRQGHEDPGEGKEGHDEWVKENQKRAPIGYAFKYTYDEDFLAKIKEDDVKPAGMEDWQYPIYKTNFSSAITQSNFTSAGLAPFGVTYTDPNPDNPNYRDFVWKKDLNDLSSYWYYGNDSFFIKPDIINDPEIAGAQKTLNSGIIIFNGTEITNDLFGGEYTDKAAMKACAEYLESKDPNHKQFSARIKATEYFRIDKHELGTDPKTGDAIYFFNPDDEDLLARNRRYSFSMTVTDETAALLNDGYQLAGFSILGENGTADVLPLLYNDESTTSDLSLKITKKSASSNAEEEDITSLFSYGNNPDNPEYFNTIYIPHNKRSSLTLNSGDEITINFMFQKNYYEDDNIIPWSGAVFEFKKELEQDYSVDTWVDAENAFVREWSSATEDEQTLNIGDTARFRVKMPIDKYLSTFSFADTTGNPISLNATNVTRIAIYDRVSHAIPVNPQLYKFNDDGTVTVEDEEIRMNYLRGGNVDGCTLAFDVKNTTDAAITYGKVACTAEAIPQPKDIRFQRGSFKMDGDNGFFTFDNSSSGIELTTGEYYCAYIPLFDDTQVLFRDVINKIVGQAAEYESVQFDLSFLDTNDAKLPLATAPTDDLKIKAIRRNWKDKADTIRDTSYYSYDSTSKEEGIKSKTSDWLTYCTNIAGTVEDFRNIEIQFRYEGPNKVSFDEVRFTMTAKKNK